MLEDFYVKMTDRNIGTLNPEQQERLRNSRISLLGLGGLGGVIGEILVRAGVGSLHIVDNDKFDITNLNRQIYCFTDTLGLSKVEVTEAFLKKINPLVDVVKFDFVGEENIDEILHGAQVAILAIDNILPCLVTSRACRRQGIPLIEGWGLPFGNTRVFMPDSPTLEEVYNLPSRDREIDSLSEDERASLKFSMLGQLKKISGIEEFYPPLAMERILAGAIPSFAPFVWLTAVLMAFETIKVLLHWGTPSRSPHFFLYDHFSNSIPEQK